MSTFFDAESGRTLTRRPSAYVYKDVFTEKQFADLVSGLNSARESSFLRYDKSKGRFTLHSIVDENAKILVEYHKILVDLARKLFSPTVLPTYCIWSIYRGSRAQLERHIDDNACTYTIDLCVSQKTQWPIYVEGVKCDLEPNSAVVYYGEDQYHWRESFPDPYNNEVEMIFFHFCEPNHWFFSKGRAGHVASIRQREHYQQEKKL